MMDLRFIYTLSLCCFVTVIGQEILQPPRDVASPLGDRVSMECHVDIGQDLLEWRFFGGVTGGTRIWSSSQPDDVKDDRYEAEVEGNIYRLIIATLTEDLTGTYSCKLVIEDENELLEVIAMWPVECEPKLEPPPNQFPKQVPEQTEMIFKCMVTVNGAKSPTIQWHKGEETVTTRTTIDPDTKQHVAVANVTATADVDEKEFHCRVSFPDPNGPLYTDECTTFYQVIHSVTNIITFPDPDNFEGQIIPAQIGMHMNCSASGRPEPSYYWYDKLTMDTRPGSLFEITPDLVGEHTWVCHASNTVMGNPRSAEREVSFLAAGYATDSPYTPEAPVVGAKTESWVIAIAIIIPLIVLIAVIIVGVTIMKKRRASKDAEKSPAEDPTLNEPLKPKPKPRPPKSDPSEDGRIYKPKSQSSLSGHPMGPNHGPSYRYAPPEAIPKQNYAPNGNTHNPEPLVGYGMMAPPEPMRRSNRSLNKSKQSLNRSTEALDKSLNRSTASLDKSLDEFGNPVPQPRPKPKKVPPPTKPKPQSMHESLGIRVLPPAPSPQRQKSVDTAV